MSDSNDPPEAEIRRVVREEIARVGRSVFSTVLWTILAAVAVLVGLQAIQMAFYTTGLVAVGFTAVGLIVTSASIYLLYLLYWE
jgi:hypothetical protein